MIKKRMNKKEAAKYFKKQWSRFIAYEQSEYDCRSENPGGPFLIDDGDKDYLIVFMPHNIDTYLKLRISKKLYGEFKKSGIEDLSKGGK